MKKNNHSSHLEEKFDALWERFCSEVKLEKEYKFYSRRRWRFDRACPSLALAIEIEGGTFVEGRHSRGKGLEADCIKYNQAALLGWKVIRLPSGLITAQYIKLIAAQFAPD